MSKQKIAVIILAAGMGTRMKSARPKVMHPLAGRQMICHLMESVTRLKPSRVVVVIGPEMKQVSAAVSPWPTVIQKKRLGTGHALKTALAALGEFNGDVLVVYGDSPLLSASTMKKLLHKRHLKQNPAVVVLAFRPKEAGAYGRIIANANGVEAIIEAKDATPEQKKVTLCNSGVMAIDGKHLTNLVGKITKNNVKGEYYLTDVVAIARKQGLSCDKVELKGKDGENEVIGINSRAELACAEAIVQNRLRQAAMNGGATLIDPASVYFSFDTRIGRDVTIGANVVFAPGVSVGDGSEIRPFCHMEGAVIGKNAVVGPFARLRPGVKIADNVHIGNFVEVKNATIEAAAKVNHLTYIGDARVGKGANIGAGTITCNYDGYVKHHTDIGAGAFIGSNTALVAPVKVGDNAVIGAGSVIVHDVDADALAVTRAQYKQIKDGAKTRRIRKTGKKKP